VRLAHIQGASQILVFLPFILLWIVAAFGTVASLFRGAKRLSRWLSAPLLGASLFLGLSYGWASPDISRTLTEMLLPGGIAFLAAGALMGWNGVVVMGVAFALSWGILALGMGLMFGWRALGYGDSGSIDLGQLLQDFSALTQAHALPWQINNDWSVVGASVILLSYLVLNVMFLEPYLGDAARYFSAAPGNVGARREIRRQGVRTLENLHLCGEYDRIVVVAHSLGTVIAYDMLRAYFSDISNQIPVPAGDEQFDSLDRGEGDLPANGRYLIEQISRLVPAGEAQKPDGKRAWLVTDFVTLGSPLTHGPYLLLRHVKESRPYAAFRERVEQREYPVCPPLQSDGDGALTFQHPRGGRFFHHGALFGLTRWANLYFPLTELFWGDAIGGPVGGELFGSGVVDTRVSLRQDGGADFFTHTKYWDTSISDGGVSPHIEALRRAANLREPSPSGPARAVARERENA